MQKKLVNHLYENLNKVEEKFPDINYGGCGAFAVILYNKLAKLGYKPQCIIISEKEYTNKEIIRNGINKELDYKINRCNTVDELEEFILLVHVILRVGKWYIDSTGVYESVEDLDYKVSEMVYVPVDFETLKRIEKNPAGWSSEYDRKETPKIKKMVDEIFEQYA